MGSDFHWQSETFQRVLKRQGQPTFFQLYTHEPDSTQHQYWKWFEPDLFLGVDAAGLASWGDKIAAIHRDFDRFLGEIAASLERDTILILASDHGHSPTLLHPLYTQHLHAPPGILLLNGPGVRQGHVLSEASVVDVTPTILHILGFPTARDFDGRVLEEAFESEWLDRAKIRRIDTYRAFAEKVEDVDMGDELNRLELERLRALGYIFN